LLPLYEAVVNSIQAIQDNEQVEGQIEVEVVRDNSHLFSEQDPSFGEIVGFTVTDNGVGFDEDNYRAFETSDTRYKASRGGKGVGRFLWLVAFDRVEIESCFRSGSSHQKRTFEFVAEGDGIREMQLAACAAPESATTVRLTGYRAKYREQCPKKLETIGSHLVESLLEYFILSDCPRVWLTDASTGERIHLNKVFSEEIESQSAREDFTVGDLLFHLLHVRLYSPQMRNHQVHFCANSRVVTNDNLQGHVSNLARRLTDQRQREFVYAGYVDATALDETVNSERTAFAIPDDATPLLTETLTWRAIREAVYERCNSFLKPYTDPIREQKEQRIREFVESDGAMYRSILPHIQEKIESIDPDLSDDALDQSLYAAYQELAGETRRRGMELLSEAPADDWDEFVERFRDYYDKLSDINKSDLARYVLHRKTVLEFLQKQISLSGDGTYPLEDRIHAIIFPKGLTSDDVQMDDHNLWVIDERLVFHSYLASDRPLRASTGVATKSTKRPDILVFNKAHAFVATDQPFTAVVIIEFKRAMRDDNSDDENPISQVLDYVRDIRAGKARTEQGRDIPIAGDIPFYCYELRT